jgi:hypothetical protein
MRSQGPQQCPEGGEEQIEEVLYEREGDDEQELHA